MPSELTMLGLTLVLALVEGRLGFSVKGGKMVMSEVG